jgi:hypothetical protein
MALRLRKIPQIISCFSLLTDIHVIFDTLLCHTTCKLRIKFEFEFDPEFFPEVIALGLRQIKIQCITNCQFSALFFSLFTDIHLIFVTLLCHTRLQIKFKFGFDPLIFYEVMIYGLSKIIRIVSFFGIIVAPPPPSLHWLCSLR